MLLIIILIFATFTIGCLGKSESRATKTKYKEVNGDKTIPQSWASFDTQGDGGDTSLEETVKLNLNSSMLTHVKVTIAFEDSDDAHAESDEGSDPDEFTVKINSSGFESRSASGKTPGNAVLELPSANATETDGAEKPTFGPSVDIIIKAECKGGKPYYIVRPGIIPVSFLVYIDQGIAYTITAEYTYNEEA